MDSSKGSQDDKGNGSKNQDMMKAPGKGGSEEIPRKDFEADTQGYFKKLRDEEKTEK